MLLRLLPEMLSLLLVILVALIVLQLTSKKIYISRKNLFGKSLEQCDSSS